ncbi:Protein kinase-like domain protein [Metarhizium album ARSEF 1941]|uniref:non-specific serine/threonine protein kinase n=1 Tax=Metarhizium album (strain ARSEF 1941) TaxID=1081103 RepID=A0A0B2WJM5_METAS|nr:Protein kinase-like domain protein [Metarhizium album ARSEF 1941]KHN96226.1 Protein kinase-like domain protein [Metarhizium album ARSEF 1941]
MLQMHGGQQQQQQQQQKQQQQQQQLNDDSFEERDRGRGKLVLPLSLPKNRSTGNLAPSADATVDRSRNRMSFGGISASAVEYDALTRPSHINDHEHGPGITGLRRIRQQHPPSRAPTMPNSSSSSRSPSVVALSRSTSMSAMLANTAGMQHTAGPASPSFSEDLSRFPSESLHSFSFAHQSEEFIHNRQTILKRSMDLMKDRIAWPMSSTQAGLASAHARVTGDVDTQNMLELLARAQLIGAGNLPSLDPAAVPAAPLTGPADVTGENFFEKQFTPQLSRTSTAASDTASPITAQAQGLKSPLFRFPTSDGAGIESLPAVPELEHESSTLIRADGHMGDEELDPKAKPVCRPASLKRTMTDTLGIALQDKLLDTMTQPFLAGQMMAEEPITSSTTAFPGPPAKAFPSAIGPTPHGHTNRWVPAAQAIFTTEAKPPWTIIAANDLACLVFGVTKAEVRKMGILEVVQEERRAWLERKLVRTSEASADDAKEGAVRESPAASAASTLLGGRSDGITAQLLNKPNSRSQPSKYGPRRAQTVHSGDPTSTTTRGAGQHRSNLSRGVLLCGDVVPIQKRNGATGSASLWVKEKKVGLIWVLEEIHEDVAYVTIDEEGSVKSMSGASATIWGSQATGSGFDVARLIPRIPRQGIDPTIGEIDFAQIARRKFFTCPNAHQINIPCSVEQVRGKLELRVSTFPHMAGIIVVDPVQLKIRSSNSVFCGALFGHEKPDGLPIDSLIPDFNKIVDVLTQEDDLQMLDGMVVPEARFRRASAFLALKEHRPDAAARFLQPDGLPARHRDGSDLKIDVQMRVVESEKQTNMVGETDHEGSEDDANSADDSFPIPHKEMVFALWITYSRHLHAHARLSVSSPATSGTTTPLHQPSPGQTPPVHTPMEIASDDDASPKKEEVGASTLSKQLKDVALNAAARLIGQPKSAAVSTSGSSSPARAVEPARKTIIGDYTILEDMGQGAYGQVKLARHKTSGKKVVLKYVTKRRILVDTWTRDRKLGTVPLEIHVLDYLRKPEFRHPNIVEMEGFFEDDINYYIEMAPHGLPGMDLFDYIELRANMQEPECRSIFFQVAKAVHFLHANALVVHRDIKDENVILDGEGNIKLIDFGSAAYIKSGPFDVFVGTIDYAAPEVLAGKPYGGKEQDVWALGILLYTIIYKENPFYSIDEIMDRDLRVPFTMSEESIDLVRRMLNRDVKERYDIHQVINHPWCKAGA